MYKIGDSGIYFYLRSAKRRHGTILVSTSARKIIKNLILLFKHLVLMLNHVSIILIKKKYKKIANFCLWTPWRTGRMLLKCSEETPLSKSREDRSYIPIFLPVKCLGRYT